MKTSNRKENFTDKILLFSDGAAKGNPGPGGWGVVIAAPDGKVKELGGRADKTTNNQMELVGVIEGLIALRRTSGDVAVFSDSVYVLRGISSWIYGWLKRGMKNAQGNEIANPQLWRQLWELVAERKDKGRISWNFLRGHSGIPGNERVDAIADRLARHERVELFNGSLLNYEYAIYDLPDDTTIPESNFNEIKEKKKAHSYLSLVNGVLKIHSTWLECEAVVKGRPGAKFKKAMSPEDEQQILKDWGLA